VTPRIAKPSTQSLISEDLAIRAVSANLANIVDDCIEKNVGSSMIARLLNGLESNISYRQSCLDKAIREQKMKTTELQS
jgi:hypothetical protein